MRHSRLVAFALTIAMLSALTAHAQTETPDQLLKRLAAEYVPAEAQVAMFASPNALLGQRRIDPFVKAIWTGECSRKLGVDADKIELALVVFDVAATGALEVGIVLHSQAALATENILPGIDTETESVHGKAYQKARAAHELSYFIADEWTIVVAPATFLEKMLAQKASSSLRSMLATASVSDSVVVAASLQLLRERVLTEDVVNVAETPFRQFAELAEVADSCELHLRLSAGENARIIFSSADSKAAEKCQQIVLSTKMKAENSKSMIDRLPAQFFHKSINAAIRRQFTNVMYQFLLGIESRIVDNRTLIDTSIDIDAMAKSLLLLLARPAASEQVAKLQILASTRQLQRIGRAIEDFEMEHGHFPQAYSADGTGQPLLSWRVHLLPYLGEKTLHDKFHFSEPWNSDHNLTLMQEMPSV